MEVIELTMKREDKRPEGATYLHKYVVKLKKVKQAIIYQHSENKFLILINYDYVERETLEDSMNYIIEYTKFLFRAMFKR